MIRRLNDLYMKIPQHFGPTAQLIRKSIVDYNLDFIAAALGISSFGNYNVIDNKVTAEIT